MGRWMEEAVKFGGKVRDCNITLDEGITKVQSVYTKLNFDPNKEDSLAFNTDLLTKEVERFITERIEKNSETVGSVEGEASRLDLEEEEEAARLAAQQSDGDSDNDTSTGDGEEA